MLIPEKIKQVIFIALLLICIVAPMEATGGSPFVVSAPVALVLGIITALTFGNPFQRHNKKATTLLLQISVVCLGFHLDFAHALKAGQQGFVFTFGTIVLTLGAGFLIGKWLKINKNTSYLISNGTAICGGSAIAAIAPIIHAEDEEISVSLGTIFILNSIALFVFPVIGHYLHLNAEQFGTWCAIAIHDTSSVVGAAANYKDAAGLDALPIAATIKLERALWIIPLSLATAAIQKSKGKIKIPYFIFYFIIAIIVSTYVHLPFKIGNMSPYDILYFIGRKGLVVTLFLIGSGLSLKTIRKVGVKPILQGVSLWVIIGVTSLFVITQIIK
jgi:uncharacterized integral membrane protein (TIGR00698 family)